VELISDVLAFEKDSPDRPPKNKSEETEQRASKNSSAKKSKGK
jgi:hypothetical protein